MHTFDVSDLRRSGVLLWVCVLVIAAVVPNHAAAQDTQVYVQDSPAAAKLLDSALDQLDKGEPAEAARLVQQLIDEHGSKLLQIEPGRYASARRIAADRLRSDGDWLEVYRELYQPIAERLLADAGNDAAVLRGLVNRYSLTDAGLGAAIRLAGLALEAGRADEARIVLGPLEKHPGIAEQRSAWLSLSVDAALLAGQNDRAAALVGELEGVDGEAADRSRAFGDSLSFEAAPDRLNPLDALPAPSDPPTILHPLWSVVSGGVERFLVETFNVDPSQLDSRGDTGGYLNTIPYLDGERLYVNDGLAVEAYEPASGLVLWRTELVEPLETFRAYGRYPRFLPSGGDLSLLTVEGDRVLAVGGYGGLAMTTPNPISPSESTLACLDSATGEVLWSFAASELGDGFEGGFIYGRPIVAHGAVYVGLRARQRTQFEDGYLLAVDVRSGEPRWVRHLASTAFAQRQIVARLDHVLLDGGWLYVDSGLGTIARIVAADGSIDWLATTEMTPSRRSYSDQQPWRTGGPVLCGAGLLVLDTDTQRVRVIDPATGKVERVLPGRTWDSPDYLLGFGDDVVAIGENAVRIDGKTLDRLWPYDPRRTPSGRAVIVGNTLWMPLSDRTNRVDLSSGREVDSVGIEGPANLLVRDGQVIATHRNRVTGYGDWESAVGRLEARHSAEPKDPMPLLAIAWLAYNADRPAELLNAVDETVALVPELAADDPALSRFFDQLLMIVRDRDRLEPEFRAELFDRLALIATTPDQHVAYRLTLADLYEQMERYGAAVDAYQSILAEPDFRRLLFAHPSGARQASLEAEQRLRRLVGLHGAGLYATYEAFAAQRLEELARQADPEPLIELADAYPLASVGADALYLAGERAAARGQDRLAGSLLRRAIRGEDDYGSLARMYGSLIGLYEDAGQPQRARQVLRSMMSKHGVMVPIRDDKPVDPAEWLERLNNYPLARLSIAKLRLPLSGKARLMVGEAGWQDQSNAIDTAPGIIVRNVAEARGAEKKTEWQLRRPSDLSVLWSTVIDADDAVVNHADSRHIWIASGRRKTVWLLDAATGAIRWVAPQLEARLADVDDVVQGGVDVREAQLQQRAVAIRLQQVAQPANVGDPTYYAAGPTAFAVADRRGRLLVIDAEDGRDLWSTPTQVVQPRQVLLDEQRVVIGGAGLRQGKPLVSVFDIETGALLRRLESQGRQGIRWMHLTDDGILLYADESYISAYDLPQGLELWTQRPGDDIAGAGSANGNVWISNDRLVIRTDAHDLLWLNLQDGRIVNRTPLRAAFASTQRLNMLNDAGMWYLIAENVLIAYDLDGTELWRDASDPSVRLDPSNAVLTEGHAVVLSSWLVRDADRRMLVYERETGRIVFDAVIDMPRPFNHLIVTGDKILIASPSETAVISGAE